MGDLRCREAPQAGILCVRETGWLSPEPQDPLGIPIFCLSRHLVRRKDDSCRLPKTVGERDVWREWALYLLTGAEATAAIPMGEAMRDP